MGVHAGENARRFLVGEPLQPFDFAFPGRNLSLGRKEGIIQMTDFRDIASSTIFTGRTATIIKEGVCRGTFKVPQWELKSGLRLMDIARRKVPAGARRTTPAGIERISMESRGIEWKPTAKAE
jgi:hypothetical protein